MLQNIHKDVKHIIDDYAKPNYEKIFLNPNFISEFEEGHSMTDCWFTVTDILVNAADSHAIVVMTCPEEYPDEGTFICYCAMSYDDQGYYLDSDSECQGGFGNYQLFLKRKNCTEMVNHGKV